MVRIPETLCRRRGANLVVLWNIDEDTEGDITALTPMRSELKGRKSSYAPPPGDEVEAVAVFQLDYVAAVEGASAYVRAELTAAQSAELEAGNYVTDLRIETDNAGVIVTDPVAIYVGERVTEPAA